jgi:hypothetical protein
VLFCGPTIYEVVVVLPPGPDEGGKRGMGERGKEKREEGGRRGRKQKKGEK